MVDILMCIFVEYVLYGEYLGRERKEKRKKGEKEGRED